MRSLYSFGVRIHCMICWQMQCTFTFTPRTFPGVVQTIKSGAQSPSSISYSPGALILEADHCASHLLTSHNILQIVMSLIHYELIYNFFSTHTIWNICIISIINHPSQWQYSVWGCSSKCSITKLETFHTLGSLWPIMSISLMESEEFHCV
jgi:hypothetical protein